MMKPSFRAFWRKGNQFVEMPILNGEIASPILGLRMRAEREEDKGWLRFYDAETGHRMRTAAETTAENDRLREENARLRRQLGESA